MEDKIILGNEEYSLSSIEYQMKFHPRNKMSRLGIFFRDRAFLKNYPVGSRFILSDYKEQFRLYLKASMFLSMLKDSKDKIEQYIYSTFNSEELIKYFEKIDGSM